MIFISVDLPAPFGPMTAIFAPGRKLRYRSLNTGLPPGYALVRPFITKAYW